MYGRRSSQLAAIVSLGLMSGAGMIVRAETRPEVQPEPAPQPPRPPVRHWDVAMTQGDLERIRTAQQRRRAKVQRQAKGYV